jgi:hypothetical protein
MRVRINPRALWKPLGLLFLYYSLAGYALYTCSQYMSLGTAVEMQQVRDLDPVEAICRQQAQCAAGAPAPDQ